MLLLHVLIGSEFAHAYFDLIWSFFVIPLGALALYGGFLKNVVGRLQGTSSVVLKTIGYVAYKSVEDIKWTDEGKEAARVCYLGCYPEKWYILSGVQVFTGRIAERWRGSTAGSWALAKAYYTSVLPPLRKPPDPPVRINTYGVWRKMWQLWLFMVATCNSGVRAFKYKAPTRFTVPAFEIGGPTTLPAYQRCHQHCGLMGGAIARDLLRLNAVKQDLPRGLFGSTDGVTYIVDSGASRTITFSEMDFVPGTLQLYNSPRKLQGIAGNVDIQGQGDLELSVKMDDGSTKLLETSAFWIPDMKCRLFSPQAFLQSAGNEECKFEVTNSGARLVLGVGPGNQLTLTFSDNASLPQFQATPVSSNRDAKALQAFVEDDENKNLSLSQKLWYKFHCRLGHRGFKQVQFIARRGWLGARAKTMLSHTIDTPHCAACIMGKQGRTPSGNTNTKDNKEGVLSKNVVVPGQIVYSDQFSTRLKGRGVPQHSGIAQKDEIIGGTVFYDASSKYLDVQLQVGFTATETIKSKLVFERMAADVGVKILSYHTDNGIYRSEEFLKELKEKGQGIKMSGVSAQFQNGAAESIIRSVIQSARTMMIHANLRWPEVSDETLWTYALKHAVHLHNVMPQEETGYSPLERWTRSKSKHSDLVLEHVWGCPAYVLSPKLRDGASVPKFEARSKRGQHMGYSPLHSSSVGLIRNLKTNHVSPQFHVLYDDHFETVTCTDENPPPRSVWETMYMFQRSPDVDWDYDVAPPELAVEWLTPEEQVSRITEAREALPGQRERREDNEDDDDIGGSLPLPDVHDTPIVEPTPSSPASPTVQVPFVDQESPRTAPPTPPSPRAVPPPVQNTPVVAAPQVLRRSARTTRGKAPTRLNYDVKGEPTAYFNTLEFSQMIEGLVLTANQREHGPIHELAMWSSIDGTIEDWPQQLTSYPAAFKAGGTPDPDSPTFREAMNGPHGEEYREAMQVEIDALENAKTWSLVDRSTVPRTSNILPLTWVYKLKRYPDGRPRKFKARLCVRGDRQVEGVDYTDKYAPVVQWMTVRMMLIITLREKLKTRVVDFTNAFAQAPLSENVYVELPRLFEMTDGTDKVMKLNKSLYGLVQAPLCWYEHLRDGLIAEGFKSSELDPCLYYGHGMAIITYVDDCLFFGADAKKIDDVMSRLKDRFLLTVEDIERDRDTDVFAYLGVEVKIDKTTGEMTFLQRGLIDKILATTGMADCHARPTPASTTALATDAEGARCKEEWGYPNVIGMLLYLTGHSRPDVQQAVHQCARFTHNPRASHEEAVKHICRYLKGTRDKGLVFRIDGDLTLDCYVDADFAGLWKVEHETDPVCVKSRTGFVIMLGGCPLLWVSRLQTEIALSTTEAEYIALSTAMRDVLPARALLVEIGQELSLSFPIREQTKAY